MFLKMQCRHINIKTVFVILLSFLINNVKYIHLVDNANHMDLRTKDPNQKNIPSNEETFSSTSASCPLNMKCDELIPPCIKCNFTENCIYGSIINVSCEVDNYYYIVCKGQKKMQKSLICRYCYQTEPWEHTCEMKANCNSVSTPRAYYQTNCTVNDNILCLGHRTFNKNVRCNWTGGYKWSNALILSITLGGFGADRFYLGHWQEGIGKLFSFGGLGVWTLIDVILISLHYLGPADGSLYI